MSIMITIRIDNLCLSNNHLYLLTSEVHFPASAFGLRVSSGNLTSLFSVSQFFIYSAVWAKSIDWIWLSSPSRFVPLAQVWVWVCLADEIWVFVASTAFVLVSSVDRVGVSAIALISVSSTVKVWVSLEDGMWALPKIRVLPSSTIWSWISSGGWIYASFDVWVSLLTTIWL